MNVALAAVTTCALLAYLVMVIQDAITLTSNSAVLARNWHGVVALTWLELVAFAWLIAQYAVMRMPKPPYAHAEHARPDLHAAASQAGKETWGGGHTAVATLGMLASALSLLLLAFWGLFS